MRRSWIRAASLVLLGLMVGAATAGVAKASAALAHACCERPASEAAAPDASDCHGFLPLSCCHAAALPGSDAGQPAPASAGLTSAGAPLVVLPAIALRSPGAALLAARLSPTRLSVVLLL